MNKNGEMWLDDCGNPIQAHGGNIIKYDNKWYWYGEHKGAANCPGLQRVDFIGISCYSSEDLLEWHYEGLALEAAKVGSGSMLEPKNVIERPKVVYNKKTKQFVMWMHVDTADYVYGGIGVAVSNTPVGPFEFLYSKQPNKQDSRDMTIFVDRDETAYLVHSSNWNKTLNISRLEKNYLETDGFYVSVLADQEREAPAMFYARGMYYMITSGCTGWDYNSALYAQCPHLLGKWKLIDNPCEGEGYRDTFKGQSTYVFEKDGEYFLMLDHWVPDDLQSSGYSILPIQLQNGRLTVKWCDSPNQFLSKKHT